MKFIQFILLIILLGASHAINAAKEPAYLQNQSDFVQGLYSKVLIGYAFERKCNFLEKAVQTEYEQRLNFVTEIFQGYILANKLVPNSTEALNYPKDMVLSAIQYAGISDCDTKAKNRVEVGFDTANNFMSLVDKELVF